MFFAANLEGFVCGYVYTMLFSLLYGADSC